MAAFTEMRKGVKFARVTIPSRTSTIGTTHLSEHSFYRWGTTICGIPAPNDGFIALDKSWVGEAPNKCKRCENTINSPNTITGREGKQPS